MNSPCTRVCVLDADNRYCIGCARTLGEITRWGSMSEVEQAALLDELPKRAAGMRDVHAPDQGGNFF